MGADAPTVERLAQILMATVAAGGSVHFMHPTPPEAATAYWVSALKDAQAGGRIVLGAFLGDRLAGTVTLWLDTPPNQPFRAEIWKLMTDPKARRRGVARALMAEAEHLAAEHGRTLLNLDTAIEDGAAELYEELGWTRAGVIPGYAFKPHGGLVGAAIYFKRLDLGDVGSSLASGADAADGPDAAPA